MNINFIGKKTTIKDSFKEHTEKKLEKLTKFFGDSFDVVVAVTNYNDSEVVEVTVKSQGMFFRAEKSDDDRWVAFDLAMDVISTQIAKNKSRLSKKFRPSGDEFFADFAPAIEETDPDEIVKTKRFDVDVMDVEEAILQMNMLNHQFFMFRNGDSGEINVVYKRNDNNYGLLEPNK